MNQAPRILAMIGSRVLYGQERANLLVLETLMAQGCKILAVVDNHPLFRTMPGELKKRGIPCVEAPTIGRRISGYLIDFLIGNPLRFFRLRRKLRSVVREWKPTHIHVPNPFAFLMAEAIAPAKLPIIYRIGDKPALHNAFWRWIWRRITQRVTHFVADSEYIADQLEHVGVNRDNVTVIFTPPGRRLVPPKPFARPEHPQNILFLGQVTADKGVDRLIEAFREVAQEYPEASLTILGRISDYSGDDWQRALRDRTIEDSLIGERVSFLGEKEDIYSYLASCAFLVAPSVCDEAFGLVVGEAKAAARASVVFPVGGLPEQVIHLEDGFICKDTSIEALAEGLRYYLSDPERTLEQGMAALSSLERLNADQFAQKWRRIYDDTLNSHLSNMILF